MNIFFRPSWRILDVTMYTPQCTTYNYFSCLLLILSISCPLLLFFLQYFLSSHLNIPIANFEHIPHPSKYENFISWTFIIPLLYFLSFALLNGFTFFISSRLPQAMATINCVRVIGNRIENPKTTAT